MRFSRRAMLSGAFATISFVAAQAATAQTAYPTKPITLIVPAASGGPTDTVARLIAESMGRTLGQTVLVENLGGAGGTLGMARVSKSAADGYTIAVWHIAHATAPALYDSLKYDVVEDFDHLGRITDVPMTLVSRRRCRPPTSPNCWRGFATTRTRPPTATPASAPPRICAC
jgi:tripartite-type tricarboxylate transporter receptor subunit TctC